VTVAAPTADVHSPAAAAASRGAVALFWERLRKKKLAMISLVVILAIYGGGILAPVIAPSPTPSRTSTTPCGGRVVLTRSARTASGATC
jgi:hypothetical protein